jgi:hypothetical protein
MSFLFLKTMFKKALGTLAALVASSPAAFAGPYVNVESNLGWAGNTYVLTTSRAALLTWHQTVLMASSNSLPKLVVALA